MRRPSMSLLSLSLVSIAACASGHQLNADQKERFENCFGEVLQSIQKIDKKMADSIRESMKEQRPLTRDEVAMVILFIDDIDASKCH